MRTIVNATLNFGLMYVPVGVATAHKRSEVSFRTLHVDCGTPISTRQVCKQCDKSRSLDSEELVSGYEVAKDQFVIVDEDVKMMLKPAREKMIEITKFVDFQEIDPVMIEKSYYLVPNQTMALRKPYEALVTALAEEGLVGIGKSTLWAKEYPVVIDSDKGALVLRTMFFADEITAPVEISTMLDYDEVTEDEMSFLRQYMHKRKDTITIDDLTNESRIKAMDVISMLASGQEVLKPEPVKQEPVTVDMLAKLKEMVAQA